MKFVPEWTQLRYVTVFGAPVFVHWTVFVMIGVLAFMLLAIPIYAALFIACYLAMLFVHELGHAIVARHLGYRVYRIRLTFWHGECETQTPETEWEHALIAWGGAAFQLVVALPPVLIMLLLGARDWSYWTPVIVILGYLNVVVAILNLLPGDETDGNLAWRVVPIYLETRRSRRTRTSDKPWRS